MQRALKTIIRTAFNIPRSFTISICCVNCLSRRYPCGCPGFLWIRPIEQWCKAAKLNAISCYVRINFVDSLGDDTNLWKLLIAKSEV